VSRWIAVARHVADGHSGLAMLALGMDPRRVARLAAIYRRDHGVIKPKLRLCLYLAIRLGARLRGSQPLAPWTARWCPALHDAITRRYDHWTKPTPDPIPAQQIAIDPIGPAEHRIRRRLLHSRAHPRRF
jgi:hypothetical protein